MTEDERHLELLSLFHYVVAGLAALFSLVPILHVVCILVLIVIPLLAEGRGTWSAAVFGLIPVVISGGFIALVWFFAGCVAFAGRSIARRQHYTFCVVMGGVECMFMPLGTILGAFTIVVLVRDSVRQLFGIESSESTTPDRERTST